jgi:putative SOS response-associated peptidase YedK
VEEYPTVIIKPEDEDLWLSHGAGSKQLTDLLKPYDAEEMEAYAVSRLVNSPGNESPEIIQRVPE